ncbi:MAG: hypothetical protein PHR06_08360 [Candidatus Cloacimonetes bacterium]|nr:hypothetical protein [Candidatus Cloacimonadota bacterium]
MKFKTIILSIITIIVAVVAFSLGRSIPISSQLIALESLRNTSAIIFGIMGAWIAIIQPELLKVAYDGKSGKVENFDRLSKPLLYSTLIIIFSLLVSVFSPLFYQINYLILHKEILRGFLFSSIAIQTILLIWSLMLSLFPLSFVRDKIQEAEIDKQIDSRN